MNVNVKKYLEAAKSSNMGGYANADGQFNGNDFGQNGFSEAAGYSRASGNGGGAPTSQPYVINVTSTSGAAVSNFDILGSNSALGNSANWTNGSYVDGSITISSGMAGVTYQEMLYQFQQKPFSVGLTYFQSATANQVTQPLQIVVKDANGNEAKRPMVPTIDPYQFQNGIVPIKQGYNVDGFTKMVISSILANATIQFQIYPSDKIDVAAGLGGAPVAKAYGDPGIVKAQTIKLQ